MSGELTFPSPIRGTLYGPAGYKLREIGKNPPSQRFAVLGLKGESGAGSGFEFVQAAPAANWIIPHTLGRRPAVKIYLSTGEAVEADVSASNSSVSITFPSPVSGSAVLN